MVFSRGKYFTFHSSQQSIRKLGTSTVCLATSSNTPWQHKTSLTSLHLCSFLFLTQIYFSIELFISSPYFSRWVSHEIDYSGGVCSPLPSLFIQSAVFASLFHVWLLSFFISHDLYVFLCWIGTMQNSFLFLFHKCGCISFSSSKWCLL